MGSILVIGESCLDSFIYCDAIKLAPDLPVPVLQEISETQNPGMAMNVYRNISSLNTNSAVLTNPDWEKIRKTRYMHAKSNHMFFRVDTLHDIAPLDPKSINFNYDLVVISDYDKGFLDQEAIKYITKIHKNVFVDTKKPLGRWIENAKFIKINDFEYRRSLPIEVSGLEDRLIVTQGGFGATYAGKSYPVEKVEIKDTSGAGDSFMAALVVEYLNSEDIIASIKFANEKATEIVKHRGVVTI
jgi:bifunctional ADP-heptose synthase (sugar kinase/adenylyltransferase)